MPKKVGHNCFQCSKLSTTEAQAKPCWDAVRCPNRRHYQRNKARISQQRSQSRPVESSDNVPRTIVIEPPIGTAVSIIFYRERQDAPVHAIAAEVWQGNPEGVEGGADALFGFISGSSSWGDDGDLKGLFE